MASTGKLEVDVEVKSDANKFWNALRDSTNLFPKAFPQHYKSVEIIEGDGKSVGSIMLIKYTEGRPITMAKQKIDSVDDTKKTLAYSIIEGEALNYYKSIKAQVMVTPKGEGSLVKWSCEVEKSKEEDLLSPDFLKEITNMTFKGLDDYLLKA